MSLLAAAGLRLFAPPLPIVIGAPVSHLGATSSVHRPVFWSASEKLHAHIAGEASRQRFAAVRTRSQSGNVGTRSQSANVGMRSQSVIVGTRSQSAIVGTQYEIGNQHRQPPIHSRLSQSQIVIRNPHPAQHPDARDKAVRMRPRLAATRPASGHVATGVSTKIAAGARTRPKAREPADGRHERKRAQSSTELPEPPIGYQSQPTLAGSDPEERATSDVPDILPTVDPQHRRRR